MTKGLPIKIVRCGASAHSSGRKFTDADIIPIERKHLASYKRKYNEEDEGEYISSSNKVLEITNFSDEMQKCIELDEELDRYFEFLGKLSRDELLAIVKYEVYNRVLMQQDLDFSSEETDE